VGDGVVAPVVRFLAENILEPILAANAYERRGRVDDHPVVTATTFVRDAPVDPWGIARRRAQTERH
jgi:hypothetical protein